ncbi:MAG: nascent polypeptide-associated complex protein [Candidatus Aenigmarchaeota archaeon ex4484_56]|nr:MAG: nascent polypeptide-associated complex protein [Candidatus Aenigmarchaeota archaeon ex4484_56]
MFPNINPKQIEKIARQMGMKIETIDAEEVIIKSENSEIIIRNPQISKVCMKGQETFQISGEIIEKNLQEEEDIELIMQKTGVDKETAEKALKEYGDIISAIKNLKK